MFGPDPWAEIYLAWTLVWLAIAWVAHASIALNHTVALLAWSASTNLFYERHAIEATSTVLAGVVFVLMVFALWIRHRHWLSWIYLAIGAAVMVWAALYQYFSWTDAYLFKATKNALYIAALLATCFAWRPVTEE